MRIPKCRYLVQCILCLILFICKQSREVSFIDLRPNRFEGVCPSAKEPQESLCILSMTELD